MRGIQGVGPALAHSEPASAWRLRLPISLKDSHNGPDPGAGSGHRLAVAVVKRFGVSLKDSHTRRMIQGVDPPVAHLEPDSVWRFTPGAGSREPWPRWGRLFFCFLFCRARSIQSSLERR